MQIWGACALDSLCIEVEVTALCEYATPVFMHLTHPLCKTNTAPLLCAVIFERLTGIFCRPKRFVPNSRLPQMGSVLYSREVIPRDPD